ncbi:MAG: hypothetical protein QG673_1174 [Pseudomonadota bacterium]|nr:hypothetical protein [Pseudomonadota bacterium]
MFEFYTIRIERMWRKHMAIISICIMLIIWVLAGICIYLYDHKNFFPDLFSAGSAIGTLGTVWVALHLANRKPHRVTINHLSISQEFGVSLNITSCVNANLSLGIITLAWDNGDTLELYQFIPNHTITSDNGTEFANHKTISQNIACTFYFARPYRSCERGLNEHTNGQIRRYLPKGTNFDTIPEDVIKKIENDLNNRPRKSLNYRTPKEVIDKYLQRVSHNHMRRKKASVAFHR